MDDRSGSLEVDVCWTMRACEPRLCLKGYLFKFLVVLKDLALGRVVQEELKTGMLDRFGAIVCLSLS